MIIVGFIQKVKDFLKKFNPASSESRPYIAPVPWGILPKTESDVGAEQSTYKKVWKNEPYVRGPVGATVDVCIKAGWKFVPRFADIKVPKGRIRKVRNFYAHPKVQFPTFLRTFITNLIVYDDVYVECAKGANGAKGIYVIETEEMKIKRDKNGNVAQYVHREGQGEWESTWEPDEMIHVSMNQIASAFYGISDLETGIQSADLSASAKAYNRNLFENKGIPTLAYLVKDASEAQFKRIKKELKAVKAGDNILLSGDITVQPIGGLNKDLEYVELLDATRREMMSVLRVPTVAIGYESKVSLEGARVQLQSFGFRINGIQQVVENAIDRVTINLFGDSYWDVRFELNEWVDPYVQAQIDAIHLKWGVIVPNEVRDRLGMKERPGGDVPYTPTTARGETNEDGMGPSTNLNEQQAERQDRDKESPGKSVIIADSHATPPESRGSPFD